MILDHHGKNLLPAVWTPDGTVSLRFRSQLRDQLRRFGDPPAYLVGDAVSHYWRTDSDVDVLLFVRDDQKAEFRHQAERASGYPLINTDNVLRFWLMPNATNPEVLARHFGPIYDLVQGIWYGKMALGDTALTRPEAVVQYINWRLYRAKFNEEVFPEDWRIVSAAFSDMHERDRSLVLDDLKYRVAAVNHSVNRVLTALPSAMWRRTQVFERELEENEELPENIDSLPRRVVLAVLHLYRYRDVLDTLIKINEKLQSYNRSAAVRIPRLHHNLSGENVMQNKRLPSVIQYRGATYKLASDLISPQPGEALSREEQILLLQSGSVDEWNRWYGSVGEPADLRGVDLQDANLIDANLQDANLQDANLRGANLQWANLEEADLRGANLEEAYLQGANLKYVDLAGANLRDANLEGANLEKADLRWAFYDKATVFPSGFDPEDAGMRR